MITSLKTDDGLIYAYLEWETVDTNGNTTEDNTYIHVRNLWIHELCRGYGALKELIEETLNEPKLKGARYVYWNRSKYNDRVSKAYKIDTLRNKSSIVKLINGEYHGK